MAWIEKRKLKDGTIAFYPRTRINGRKNCTAGGTYKPTAQKLRRKLEDEQVKYENELTDTDVPLSQAMNEYIQWSAITDKSASTLRGINTSYNSHLKPFFGEHKKMMSFTEESMRDLLSNILTRTYIRPGWKKQKKYSINGAAISMRVIKAFFAWATRKRYCDSNPCIYRNPLDRKKKNIVAELKPEDVQHPLTAEEKNQMIEFCGDNTRLREIIEAYLETGMRANELIKHSRFEWIDRVSKTLVIPKEFVKGEKPRVIVLIDTIFPLFCRKDKGFVFEGWSYTGFYQALRRLKKRAGIVGRVRPHDMRHTFSKTYMNNGGNLGTLSRLLGHSSIDVTRKFYEHYDVDTLRKEANERVKYEKPAA